MTFFAEPRHRLFEYRGAWTKLIPAELTEADKLNGIQYQGIAMLGATAYRVIDTDPIQPREKRQWSEWENGLRMSTENAKLVMAGTLSSGNIQVEMERRNNRWTFQFPGILGSSLGSEKFDPASFAGGKKSCAALTSPNPFAEEDNRARKEEEERQAAAAAALAAQERAAELEHQKWQKLEESLRVQRDLGQTLLCRNVVVKMSLGSRASDSVYTPVLVNVIGATEENGRLGEWLRVQPDFKSRTSLGNVPRFVEAGSISDQCPGFHPQATGLLSAAALRAGIRAAGGLDRWPEFRRQQAAKESEHVQEMRAAGQLLKICNRAVLWSNPPSAAVVTHGTGRNLGTTGRGDEAMVLQNGEVVSKVEFDVRGQRFSGWLENAAFCPGPAGSAAAPPPGEPHTLVLTPTSPVGERTATIVAPGNGLQAYNVYYIDARAFPNGGVLDIDVWIPADSATDGSFDLFPANVPIPRSGSPNGAVAGRHDVQKGSATNFHFTFSGGQTLALGLEGNWFSPKGASGSVRVRASVRPEAR